MWADRRPSGSADHPSSSDGREEASTKAAIFWINGSAGTGKTTIAYTMAKYWDSEHKLGASFFCSRDDAKCRSRQLIFTTIAYQLGRFNPAFGEKVSEVMESKPDIELESVSSQLEQLIVNPLLALGEQNQPFSVVVIDALDECKDNDTTSSILEALALHVSKLSQLSFLITSRPEHHITSAFQSSDLQAETRRFVLHEVQLDVVRIDIREYFSAKLKDKKWRLRFPELEESWPSEADIQKLSDLSSGLFIFAATCIKFIRDRNALNPRDQLKQLLPADAVSSPHNLDELYLQVLNHAHPNPTDKLSKRLRLVLGSIVHLQDRLSVVDLGHLLWEYQVRIGAGSTLEVQDSINVESTLKDLHSIVLVPDADAQVIRMLHPSFFDFLTDSSRCLNSNFVVDTRDQHSVLALACLGIMRRELASDMCQLASPTALNAEIEHIAERITKHIPSFLQYACRHWGSHFASATLSDVLLQLLEQFVDENLLHWIEVCSLLGELQGATIALDVSHQALIVSDFISECSSSHSSCVQGRRQNPI